MIGHVTFHKEMSVFVCSLLSLLQVHAIYEVAAAILTNTLLQMAGRGIVLVCFGGSSQGFYSL